MRRKLALSMGAIIGLADLYWLYLAYSSYTFTVPVMLGIIIMIADLFWMYLDK